MDTTRQFALTKKGCEEAEKWLKDIGEYERIFKSTGADGWSITENANRLYERHNSRQEMN